jgi:transcriptional regulator with XRE-family HTH domain
MNLLSPLYTAVMAGRPPTKAAPPFGAKLAELRKLRGLTQPQLAEQLDVSLDMLIYYERRANNPSADFVKKAATFFNVSADELLGHSVQARRKSGPPSQLEQRLAALQQLPREKQKLVLQILDTFLRDAQQGKAA